MRFREEEVVEKLLPAIRFLLVGELRRRGWNQARIAASLDLSQAAISKYLRRRFRPDPRFLAHPEVRGAVGEVAKGMAAGALGAMEALDRFEGLIRRLEAQGDLPARPGSESVEEERVLNSLRRGARLLERESAVVALLPHVGSNLAMALPGAGSRAEVAAFPGRINELRGAARPPGEPEFGASRHVAEVVLGAHRARPAVRAAMNVAARPEVLAAAKGLGWALEEFRADYEGRGDRIHALLKRRKRAPDLLYHKGAHGIEPMAYLLGTDGEAVAKRAVELAGRVGAQAYL
ncbi:MAG: thiamine-phosphate synthase family protein [Halobacteria archaeon]